MKQKFYFEFVLLGIVSIISLASFSGFHSFEASASPVNTINGNGSSAQTINGQTNNVTVTDNGATHTVGLGPNAVITGGSTQTITKSLIANLLTLGGFLNANSQNITNTGVITFNNSTIPAGSTNTYIARNKADGNIVINAPNNFGLKFNVGSNGKFSVSNTFLNAFGNKLDNLGTPTVGTDAQEANHLGILGNLVVVKCAGNQILQYQSSNTTWICTTISTNGNTSASQTFQGSSGNVTVSDSGSTHTFNLGTNPVITGGAAQTVTKGLTLNALTLGGNALGNSKNFTGLRDTNSTRIFQNGNQAIDTLNQGTAITITGTGNSRTISSSALTAAITSINGDITAAQKILRESGNTTVTNSTGQVKVGIGPNVVITGGAAQTISKQMTFSKNLYAGDNIYSSNSSGTFKISAPSGVAICIGTGC